MRPRRTVESNQVFRLAGGTEDNDLWTRVARDEDGLQVVISTWEPTDEERSAIAAGANIELCVWGGQPPVSLAVTQVQLGRG